MDILFAVLCHLSLRSIGIKVRVIVPKQLHSVTWHLSETKELRFPHQKYWEFQMYMTGKVLDIKVKAVTSCSTHKIDQQEIDG